MADANCTPLSEVRVQGTPKRLTHPVKKAAAHSSVEVPQMGTASAHLVLLSTIVKRWEKPPLAAGSGPTRSTCTCENRFAGSSIGWTCVCTADVTLLLAHCWQLLQNSAMSAPIHRHTNRLETSLLVARMPGWAMLCRERMTACL